MEFYCPSTKRGFGIVSWPNGMHDVSTIHDAFCDTYLVSMAILYMHIHIQMHTGGKAISFQASHNITIEVGV